jgi:hypothetical protein
MDNATSPTPTERKTSEADAAAFAADVTVTENVAEAPGARDADTLGEIETVTPVGRGGTGASATVPHSAFIAVESAVGSVDDTFTAFPTPNPETSVEYRAK